MKVGVPDMLLTLLPPPLLLLSLGPSLDFWLISVVGTEAMLFLERTAV